MIGFGQIEKLTYKYSCIENVLLKHPAVRLLFMRMPYYLPACYKTASHAQCVFCVLHSVDALTFSKAPTGAGVVIYFPLTHL